MITKNANRNRIFVSLAVVTIILISAVYFGLNMNQGGHPPATASPSGSGSLAQTNQNGHLLVLTGAGVSNQAVGGDPAGSGNLTRTISVSGTGQVSFTPDEALIYASVVTVGATAGAATAENAAATLEVIRALNSIGIANSSMQTTGYNLSPNYNNYGGSQPPQILGFTVTNSLQVNVTVVGSDQLGLKTGQVIDTAVKAGANQVSLQFTASNHELAVLNNEALQQAVLSASSQARTIANALGVSITGVLTASEGYSYSPQSYSGLGGVFAAETATAVLTPIVPNSMTATATVQVTYTIS